MIETLAAEPRAAADLGTAGKPTNGPGSRAVGSSREKIKALMAAVFHLCSMPRIGQLFDHCQLDRRVIIIN